MFEDTDRWTKAVKDFRVEVLQPPHVGGFVGENRSTQTSVVEESAGNQLLSSPIKAKQDAEMLEHLRAEVSELRMQNARANYEFEKHKTELLSSSIKAKQDAEMLEHLREEVSELRMQNARAKSEMEEQYQIHSLTLQDLKMQASDVDLTELLCSSIKAKQDAEMVEHLRAEVSELRMQNARAKSEMEEQYQMHSWTLQDLKMQAYEAELGRDVEGFDRQKEREFALSISGRDKKFERELDRQAFALQSQAEDLRSLAVSGVELLCAEVIQYAQSKSADVSFEAEQNHDLFGEVAEYNRFLETLTRKTKNLEEHLVQDLCAMPVAVAGESTHWR